MHYSASLAVLLLWGSNALSELFPASHTSPALCLWMSPIHDVVPSQQRTTNTHLLWGHHLKLWANSSGGYRWINDFSPQWLWIWEAQQQPVHPSLLVQPILPVQGLQCWSELLEQHWVSASCNRSGFGDCSRQENLDSSFFLCIPLCSFSVLSMRWCLQQHLYGKLPCSSEKGRSPLT